MSLLSNSSSVSQYLQLVRSRSQLMYDHRAYWHWYEKFGLERDAFEQSLASLQIVIDNYEKL